MRRSPLVRRTPLRAKAAAKPTQAKPAVPTDVRAAMVARSGGRCEMRLPGCQCTATDPAHRLTRGMGGRHRAGKTVADRLSNVIHACRACHRWCHARPGEAYELGLMLHTGQDPTTEPVQLLAYDSLPVYLDDTGGWHRYEEVGA